MSLAPDEPVEAAGRRRPRSAAMATLVLSGANVLRLGAQLCLLPILARLVGPADYGLVALAMPFILFCNVMADGGLSTALARRQDPGENLESTVFWIGGGIGAALAVLAAGLAYPVGMVLGQPRLPWLIAALAPVLTLSGFTAAANARIIRERRFGVFAAGDVISTLASSAAALAAALNGWAAWSLVVQQLVLWTCKAAWVVSASRVPIRLHCRPAEARDLFRFGRHSIGTTLGDFVTRNLDNVIVGATLGALALGYYAMAYQIIRAPDLIISGPLYLLIFSAVSQAAAGKASQTPAVIGLAALRLAATVLAPVFVGLGLTAALAIGVVLGPEWQGATVALAWLSVAGFGFSIVTVASATLMGLGRSQVQLRMALAGGAVTIAGVAAASAFGLAAVAGAVAAITLAMMFVYLIVLSRELAAPIEAIAGAMSPAAIAAAVMAGVLWVAQAPLAGLPPLLRLVTLAVLGALAYAAVVWASAGRRLVADLRVFRT